MCDTKKAMHPAYMQFITIFYHLMICLVHFIIARPLLRLDCHEFCFVFGKHIGYEKLLNMVTGSYSNSCSYVSTRKGSNDKKSS